MKKLEDKWFLGTLKSALVVFYTLVSQEIYFMLSSEEYIRDRQDFGCWEARIFYSPELDAVVAAGFMDGLIFNKEELFQLGSLLLDASINVSGKDICHLNNRTSARGRSDKDFWLQRKNRSGLVYLIKAIGTNYYKIGRTKDIETRLETLQKSSPFDLSLILAIETSDSLALEKYFHDKYNDCRVRGEWFELDEYAIAEFMSYEEVA